MLSALLDIVIPVFAVAGLGALYGRLRPGADLGYVNRANIELFTPALVFSALVKYPLDLAAHLPLVAAGALVILLPGLLLALLGVMVSLRTWHATALCLLVMTVLGIPVSTTHTKTSAIMGVGAVRRLSAINFGVVRDMMLTWVFTFPGCGLISFVMAKLFMVVF